MFWKAKNNILRRITVRLTLLYMLIFSLLLMIVFFTIQYSLLSSLKKRIDNYIVQYYNEYSWIDGMFNDNPADKVTQKLSGTFHYRAGIEKNYHIFFVLLSPQAEIKASSNLYRWEGMKFTLSDIPFLITNTDTTLDIQPYLNANQENLKYINRGANDLIALKLVTFPETTRIGYKRFQDGNYFIIGVSYKQDALLLTLLRRVFLIAFGIMLFAGGFLSYSITQKAMNGVARVTNTAISISQGNLLHRVPPGREGLEVENLAAAFNTMLDKINSLFLELKQVTNNIAHDLRSPVTSIRGMAETTATRNSTNEDYKLTLGMIVEECDQLISMVNTMLDISEIESGVMKLSRNPVDLNIILKEICELYNFVAEDRGLLFHCHLNEHSYFVPGDSILLKRVFSNIIDNAFKFTTHGKIDISIQHDAKDVIVAIADTGIGIPPQDLPHIFDRFYRGDASRSTKGNGLGLCLALGIIQAHGGDIRVSSAPNSGSLFQIILPALS